MEIIAIQFIWAISAIISEVTQLIQTNTSSCLYTTELIICITVFDWSWKSTIIKCNVINSNVTLETVRSSCSELDVEWVCTTV